MRFRQHSSLAETLSFAVIHLVLAVAIGWLLSGTFAFGAMLALLEPLCNTIVSHVIGKFFRSREGTGQAVLKSAVIGVAHLFVAVGLTRLLTGSFAAAWAYALIEPAANAVAHYYFERWWHRTAARTAAAQGDVAAAFNGT